MFGPFVFESVALVYYRVHHQAGCVYKGSYWARAGRPRSLRLVCSWRIQLTPFPGQHEEYPIECLVA
jgi:hypothetical protein